MGQGGHGPGAPLLDEGQWGLDPLSTSTLFKLFTLMYRMCPYNCSYLLMQLLVFQLQPVVIPPVEVKVKVELEEEQGKAPGCPKELQAPDQAPTLAAMSNSCI